MPRLDKHHEIVKSALNKSGWKIVYDPVLLQYKGLRLYIDLGAERINNGEQAVIEVKVFGGNSLVDEFEKAIGQYSLYRFVLKKSEVKSKLYLAITDEIFEKFVDKPAILEYIDEHEIHLLIFNSEKEEITQWIK
jgi:XisH protein